MKIIMFVLVDALIEGYRFEIHLIYGQSSCFVAENVVDSSKLFTKITAFNFYKLVVINISVVSISLKNQSLREFY